MPLRAKMTSFLPRASRQLCWSHSHYLSPVIFPAKYVSTPPTPRSIHQSHRVMAPKRPEIELIFNHLASAQYELFFNHVAENVSWTVMGTHPLAGTYNSRSAFVDATIKRLNAIFKEPIQLKVRNVVGGGDQDWSVTELMADAVCKNGMEFNNRYSWVCRWEGDTIVEVRAYLDSELVKRAIEQNEQH